MMRCAAGILLVLTLLFTLAPAPAALAQSKLGVEIGPLLPMGDLDDGTDVSLYIGGRWEWQKINPLGQLALVSLYARGGYAALQLDDATKTQLAAQGEDTDASLLDLGLGLRAHAATSPFFLSAGVGYVHLDSAGAVDGDDGFQGQLGLGLSFGAGGVAIEIEGRGNIALMQDVDNLEWFTITAGAGLPF